jgi:hypothetical protein
VGPQDPPWGSESLGTGAAAGYPGSLAATIAWTLIAKRTTGSITEEAMWAAILAVDWRENPSIFEREHLIGEDVIVGRAEGLAR